ncbi:MAG: hypothetical protein M8353_03785 [ANME-2 cluster archaeon]|nr:hypothetical protein [ANME-2 cluster archaeon]
MSGWKAFSKDKMITTNTGILILGLLWLVFWLGPAYSTFLTDSRWGHNFALPLTFITVGMAYHFRMISCQLVAVIAVFLMVPGHLAFWPWHIATSIAAALFVSLLILYGIERGRETELLQPNRRLRSWLRLHLMTFAYIGLAHIPLTFFLVRWANFESFADYLPVEQSVPIAIFNAMLIILVLLAIMERFVMKVGMFEVAKLGFVWSMLMIVIPLLTVNFIFD